MRKVPATCRAFTLVEMLVVVIIVGVLAVVCIGLMRKHIYSAKSAEATAMVQSIRAAQERWRAERATYLDVSETITSWYPMGTPGKVKYHWVQTDGHRYTSWMQLNPTAPGPVQCGYAVRAGVARTSPPALATFSNPPAWPVPNDNWYLIHAECNVDGDEQAAHYAASSFSGEVASENEGE